MIRTTATLLAVAALSGPVFAESHASGDPEAGESAFRQCQTCHVVESPDGETLAGRGPANRQAPNLYGVAGRTAGIEDFRYSDAMVAAGEAGLAWTEEEFVAYVQDPTPYLRAYLDDNRARGKMSYKVRSEEDAVNLYAYLAQFGAADGEMEEEDATN